MASVANDNFENYFTEKIWQLIPAFYRDQDDAAGNPGVLRGIVQIMAAQAAVQTAPQIPLDLGEEGGGPI